MDRRRVMLACGAALAPLLVATSAGAAATVPHGDLAGYTVTPGGSITQISMTVSVPTAVTSTDCNTAGNNEYAEFGIRLSTNTFARVDATCGNSGTITYFGDIEVAGTLKIVILKAGQQVTLSATVSGTKMTIALSHDSTYKQVTGSPGPFSSAGLGGTYVPGFDIPVLTTNSHFASVKVDNVGLSGVPKVQTSLANSTHVLMLATAVNSANAFNVKYVAQS